MKTINIKWDIDMEDILKKLDNLTNEKVSKILGIPERICANLTTTEKYDYTYSLFYNNDSCFNEFMELPTEMEIPKEIENDEDAISDYLSDETGFCHYGFELV